MTVEQVKKILKISKDVDNKNNVYVVEYNTGNFFDPAYITKEGDKLVVKTSNGTFKKLPKEFKAKDFKVYKVHDWTK